MRPLFLLHVWILGVVPFPLGAQLSVVIHGRVEDASSLEPIEGALVLSADSTSLAITDSLGVFALPLSPGAPLVVTADHIAYEPDVFELPASAPSQISILRLEPGPVPIEGFSVVEESALIALVDRMGLRRRAYPGTVRAYDRERVARTGAADAAELVLREAPGVADCRSFLSRFPPSNKLCRDPQGRASFAGPPATIRPGERAGGFELMVCVDGARSSSHFIDLGSIPIEQVATFEFYWPQTWGPTEFSFRAGQVRIYTRQWMSRTAARPRVLMPALIGC